MKRYASIDIGTNTALMVIADVDEKGRLHPLYDDQRFPRLGKGVGISGRITPESVERLTACLQEYSVIARTYDVTEVIAAGTSALRDATNRDDVLKEIAGRTGIRIEVLSGNTEAEYTYTGVLSGLYVFRGTTGILDIGGGSTELSVGSGGTIRKSYSVDIGCVRLTESFFASLPPSESAYSNASGLLTRQIGNTIPAKRLDSLIGVAGTVTTLAAIDKQLIAFDPVFLDGHILSANKIEEMLNTYKRYTVGEMKQIQQISPGREDILLAGILILRECMARLNATEIIVSTRGLRYGHIIAHALKK